MDTQFEADADTKIGSAAVERLYWNKSVLPKEDGADILVLCLHQDHKNELYLKMCGMCRISQRDNLSLQLQWFAIVLQGYLVTIRLAGFIVGRKGKRSEKNSGLIMLMN